MAKKQLVLVTTNPFVYERNHPFIVSDEPSLVVKDATLTIQQIAQRYYRGNLDGVNIHPKQYSLDLEPLRMRGVDLCDFSAIKEHYAGISEKLKVDLDTINEEIRRLSSLESKPDDEPKA